MTASTPAAARAPVQRRRLPPEARRREIVEATLASLARRGAKETGLRQVCRDLGIAPGLVNHLFDGWEAVLRAAYASLWQRFEEALHEQLAQPQGSAAARLESLIDWYFSEPWLSSDYAGAYVALWSLARGEVDISAPMENHRRTLRDRLESLIAQLLAERGSPAEAREAADTLLVFVEGAWMQMATGSGDLNPEKARRLARFCLEGAILERERAAGALSGR